MKRIPEQFKDRIGYGLYGGVVQFYIKGVDGTLAQIGHELPNGLALLRRIAVADKAHKKLIADHEKS